MNLIMNLTNLPTVLVAAFTVLTAMFTFALVLPGHGADPNAEAIERIPTPEAQLKNFTLAPGYDVNLYASEVDSPLYNPMGMAFDAEGRLWVITSPTYPHLAPGKNATDKLLYFEDTNSDGVADKHTVFLDDLLIPTGFALDTDGVYLAQQPNLWFVQDTDSDGKADRKTVLMHGFSVEDSHHSISAFTWGPDGSFYFNEGVFLYTQVETPYGPRRSRDGAVHRFKPSTLRFDVMSHRRYSNPWGMAFDRWGQSVLSDASDGNHYNFASVIPAFDYPDKIVPAETILKRGRPMAGSVIVSSRQFPDDVQGTHLNNQSIGFQGSRWDRLIEDGSGWRTEPLPDLIQSTELSYRPVASAFGPDGALYVLDFCNPRIGHMHFSRGEVNRDYSHGRIWRVTAKDRPLLTLPKIRGESPERLLELLSEPENHVRHWARRFLQKGKEDEVMPAVKKWIEALPSTDPATPHLLTEALWIYAGRDVIDRELLEKVLNSEEPKARAAATRVVRHWLEAGYLTADDGVKLLAKLVVDPNQRVRLEAVLASGFVQSPDGSELAAFAATMPMDKHLRTVLQQTLKVLSKYGEPTSDLAKGISLRLLPKDELTSRQADVAKAKAILRRDDFSREEKESSLNYLMNEEKVSRARVLVDLLGELKAEEVGALETLRPMILECEPADLQGHLLQLTQFASSAETKEALHVVLAALTLAEGNFNAAITSGQQPVDLYSSLLLISDEKTLSACYDPIRKAMLQYQNDATRRAAYLALAHIPEKRASTIELLGETALDEEHRTERRFAAIEALNTIPEAEWPEALKPFRLATVTVRAIESSLLFDTKQFVVKAGQPVKILFENPDAVDHNLVIGTPGSLQEIGIAATEMVALPNEEGLKQNYLPDLPSVLAGTEIIGRGQSAELTLFAPSEPGDYIYVCTYPGHFGTMNGIMRVD